MTITAILRLSGDIPADAHLGWVPDHLVGRVWRIGDVRLRDRRETTSGFTLLLADRVSREVAVDQTEALLRDLRDGLLVLVRQGASVELDFALYVGTASPQSIVLPTSLVAAALECQATLIVSAYPCSDSHD